MSKFKKGDKVMMAVGSEFYTLNTPYNPRNMEGTITYIGGRIIQVTWKNSKINTYSERDLIHFKIDVCDE